MSDYPDYVVWFRGFPCCPCQYGWLPVFEDELLRRGVIKESIDIAQLIGGAKTSGGTHTDGGAIDIWQHDDVTVWVARQMGADASWARTTGSFANNRHSHIVLNDCPHNGPARYQITAVREGYDGLGSGGRGAPDPGPRPLTGRTWRQGIAWAKQLQEDDMSQHAEVLKRIEENTKTLIQGQNKLRRQQGVARTKLTKLVAKGNATRDDLKEVLDALASE